MKKFYVSLHLKVEAEDIDTAYSKAGDLAEQAAVTLDECVLECWYGEVEECEDGASEVS